MGDAGICGSVLEVCGGRGSTGVMGRWGAGGFSPSTSSGRVFGDAGMWLAGRARGVGLVLRVVGWTGDGNDGGWQCRKRWTGGRCERQTGR